MQTWRLLPLETHNAPMNMAIDEAILTARIANSVPNTLRLYRWRPSAVSIGKNQNPQETIYTENLHKLGVDLVRRISGGGTVFHDAQGEITYSVTAHTHDLAKGDITSVYTQIYTALTQALSLISVTADYNPGTTKNCPNLTINGKKISGNAQTIKQNTLQQHGTLLLKTDLQTMYQLLRVKNTTPAEAAHYAQTRITSIQNELGHAITPETAANALAKAFETTLKIHLVPDTLTPAETQLAQQLCTQKYTRETWNQNGK